MAVLVLIAKPLRRSFNSARKFAVLGAPCVSPCWSLPLRNIFETLAACVAVSWCRRRLYKGSFAGKLKPQSTQPYRTPVHLNQDPKSASLQLKGSLPFSLEKIGDVQSSPTRFFAGVKISEAGDVQPDDAGFLSLFWGVQIFEAEDVQTGSSPKLRTSMASNVRS